MTLKIIENRLKSYHFLNKQEELNALKEISQEIAAYYDRHNLALRCRLISLQFDTCQEPWGEVPPSCCHLSPFGLLLKPEPSLFFNQK